MQGMTRTSVLVGRGRQRGAKRGAHLAGRGAMPAQHAQQAAGQHARRQPHQHPARRQLQGRHSRFNNP